MKDHIDEVGKSNIRLNDSGEFVDGCVCGGNDFYTVVADGGRYREIEPVTVWDGWGCVSCERVWSDAGVLLAHPDRIIWLT